MKKRDGFTFIEFVVVAFISSILALVIQSFLVQSNRLAVASVSAQAQDAKNTHDLSWIMDDLRHSLRHSLGSHVLNGGFEMTYYGEPDFWTPSPLYLNGTYVQTDNSTPESLHSGQRSVELYSYFGSAYYMQTTSQVSLYAKTAYMISGWAKGSANNTDITLSLVDSSGSVLASSTTRNSSWQHIYFRYPVSGFYTLGLVSGNKAFVRISVNNGTDPVFFDDIGATPIHSVLLSSVSSQQNIPNGTVLSADPNENVGLNFLRYENNLPVRYRYRIINENNVTLLSRETYEPTSNLWTRSAPLKLFSDIQYLSFYFDKNHALPENGQLTSLKMVVGYKPVFNGEEKIAPPIQTVTISPLTP